MMFATLTASALFTGSTYPAQYQTTWLFESQAGAVTTTYESSQQGKIPMPIWNEWVCDKNNIQIGSDSSYLGSFTCTNGRAFVSIAASCKMTQQSFDSSKAFLGGMVGHEHEGYIVLSVRCQTSFVTKK